MATDAKAHDKTNSSQSDLREELEDKYSEEKTLDDEQEVEEHSLENHGGSVPTSYC